MFDPSRKPTQIPSYNPETSPYEREKGGFRVSGPMTGFLLVLLGVFFGALLFTYEVKVGPELNIQEKGSFFGIPGAYAAYGLYLLFGAVAVFLPLIFVWWGIYQMTHKGLLPARVIMSGIGMVLFACIAAGGQQIIGVEWANNMGVTCFGGEIGAFLGWQLITPQLGVYGTVAVATLFYLISLVYLTGMKMRPFLRTVWLDYRQWKEKRQVQEAWTPDHLDRPRDDGSLAAMLDRKSSGVVDPVVAPVEPLPRRESVPVEPVRQREEEPTAPVRPVRVNRVEERRELKEKEAEEGTLPLPLRPAPQIIDSTRMKVVKTVDRMQGREELPAPQSVEPSATESDDGKKKYILPSLNLLNEPAPIPEGQNELDKQELEDTQKRIIEALRSFNIEVAPGDITRGPTITRYEIYPSIGTRVNKISSLEANLALATKAERINILAPIPGKDTVGIEIANSKKVAVPLRELLSDHAFVDSKKKIPLALGKDVYGSFS